MYLIHESTIKHPEGIIEIIVHIIKGNERKRYTYHLDSGDAARKFHFLYRKGRELHGRALALLNKNKITQKAETEEPC